MIPVNLVTGFLGVGKTTLIHHLLQQVPAGERWAVLVNEFGEIGVDSQLLEQDQIAIEEVAGGCLCCVAAPAFTVGLNRLIRQTRPTRILIEPSGLGHPAQVLEQLRSPIYQDILEVRATLTVMDARHLSSSRHREHETFIDQIHLADILIANKADTYSALDEQAFERFAADQQPPKARLLITEHGKIDAALLDTGSEARSAAFPEAHAFLLQQTESNTMPASTDWLCIEGHEDGYFRIGWLIQNSVFDQEQITAWLNGLDAERIKASICCEPRGMQYNRAEHDTATVTLTDPVSETRIQLLSPSALDAEQLDAALRQLA